MGTEALAAVVVARVVVIPKEIVGVEEKALGDRIILLAMKLFLTSGISISRI